MGVSDTQRWSATRKRIREPRQVTLEKARRKATALREQFLEGRDPRAEKRQAAHLLKWRLSGRRLSSSSAGLYSSPPIGLAQPQEPGRVGAHTPRIRLPHHRAAAD
jgi:hypothetical protein